MFENCNTWKVVKNLEAQYSIWPSQKNAPLGWIDVSVQGTKEQCLSYIKDTWKDMRPRSLREKMDR